MSYVNVIIYGFYNLIYSHPDPLTTQTPLHVPLKSVETIVTSTPGGDNLPISIILSENLPDDQENRLRNLIYY